ncbi:hypothetical protein ON010_g17628 [Phytophthora cinnamomi]|nr:hypothetical protein ON010_g17628 [Phytophthora cinnamomi]
MPETNDAREQLSPGQKKYVVRCLTFMVALKAEKFFNGTRTRDLVAKCLGIGHSTVTVVVEEFYEVNETNFEPKRSMRGKPRLYDPAGLEPFIRSFITATNKLVQPVTTQKSYPTRHTLLCAPPYHSELQPIGLIWANAKGKIAGEPPVSGNDAVEKVRSNLHKVIN